jgi:hypothetical protein
MKHLATIQHEFLIQAKQYSRRWLKMNMQQQRQYLEDHPGSKKVVNAKPSKRKKYRLKPKYRKIHKNEKTRHVKTNRTMDTLQGVSK